MNIEPLYEQVLIKPYETEKVTAGGVKIPETLQERPSKGLVVSVGCGLKERPMEVKVGWTAFYIKGAGTQIEEDGEKYLLMRDKEVLAQIPIKT